MLPRKLNLAQVIWRKLLLIYYHGRLRSITNEILEMERYLPPYRRERVRLLIEIEAIELELNRGRGRGKND